MSQIITDADGNEVEVFTAEELQAQKDAAIDEFKKANPDKSDELKKAMEDLEKFKDKDLNFASLRKQKEDAEKKVEDILKGVDEKVATVKKEVLEGVMKDHYQDTLRALVGDDKELLDKVELQYKRLGDPASSKGEVTKKLSDAFLLATGSSKPGVDSGVYSSGGVSKIKVDDSSKMTDEEKDFLGKLGVKTK